MTVSMHVMSAGNGYKYLLKSVAAGDGDRSLSTPLTRYYAEAGSPPGFWLGSGITAFGAGRLAVGSQVSEQQLQLLVGMGRDPLTGAPLGLAYQQFASIAERVETWTWRLSLSLDPAYRADLVAEIEAEEKAREIRQAVAELLGLIEREVAATSVGDTGSDGAIAQVDVQGVAATAFDHYNSHSHDPQLHTHVVISNKVKTVQDGKWRPWMDGQCTGPSWPSRRCTTRSWPTTSPARST